MFQQAGVIVVDTLEAMLDVAQLLAHQPLPAGPNIAVVGNSDALALLAADTAAEVGLPVVHHPTALRPDATPEDFEHLLVGAVEDPSVHSVVAVYVSPVDVDGRPVAEVIARVAATSAKPIVATFLGSEGVPEPLRHLDERAVVARGSVPSYPSPQTGVRALAKVTEYAGWRREPRGTSPSLDGIDEERARAVVDAVLADHPDGADLEGDVLYQFLRWYGITVVPAYPVRSLDEALAAARRLGWDVVLKATAPQLRQRPDLSDVWRNIDSEAEMRAAWQAMTTTLGDPAKASFVVQRMVDAGVPVVVSSVEDRMFGPVVSFGLAGVAADLLGDLAYRIPPLTDVDVASMVREVRASPLLFGHPGGVRADVSALEELLHRVGRLAYDLPEVVEVELVPVFASPTGVSVLGASVHVAPIEPRARTDWYVRRLTRL